MNLRAFALMSLTGVIALTAAASCSDSASSTSDDRDSNVTDSANDGNDADPGDGHVHDSNGENNDVGTGGESGDGGAGGNGASGSSGGGGNEMDGGADTASDASDASDAQSPEEHKAPFDLDETGATIPDTNYPIPDNATFLSVDGDDSNDGKTVKTPVRTLNRAIELTEAGGTVVVRKGLYRDWYHNKTKSTYKFVNRSMTFQAYPHEQAWFDGTDDVSKEAWKKEDDGTWSLPWDTPEFCDGKYYDVPILSQKSDNTGPCYHYDVAKDPDNPLVGDPQMAFVDGINLHQVATRAEASNSTKNFYYDHKNRVIYIGVDPKGKRVELTRRPLALVMGEEPPKHTVYTIRGLGFRRFATHEADGISDALYIGGSNPKGNALVENCAFTLNAAGGLYMRSVNGVVRHSVFARNGFTSLGSNGHSVKAPEIIDGLVIEDSRFSENNTESFGVDCTASCGSAGVKIAHMNGFLVRNNLFENNKKADANGFWCDLSCKNGIIIGNLSRNNGGSGIYYEVSDGAIIASNLVYGNKRGINVCSANTKIYNNTVVDNSYSNIYIYDDSRNASTFPERLPDTNNVDVTNNIMFGGGTTYPFVAQQGKRDEATDPKKLNTGPNTFMTGMDYNCYYRTQGPKSNLIAWQDDDNKTLYLMYRSLDEFRADWGWKGFESKGCDISSGSDPFFIDVAAHDYQVRKGSPAYQNGKPLPKDVADALGLPSGAVLSRGAVFWPGKK